LKHWSYNFLDLLRYKPSWKNIFHAHMGSIKKALLPFCLHMPQRCCHCHPAIPMQESSKQRATPNRSYKKRPGSISKFRYILSLIITGTGYPLSTWARLGLHKKKRDSHPTLLGSTKFWSPILDEGTKVQNLSGLPCLSFYNTCSANFLETIIIEKLREIVWSDTLRSGKCKRENWDPSVFSWSESYMIFAFESIMNLGFPRHRVGSLNNIHCTECMPQPSNRVSTMKRVRSCRPRPTTAPH